MTLPALPPNLPDWPVERKLLYARGKSKSPGPVPGGARRWFNETLRPYAHWRIDLKGDMKLRPAGLQRSIPQWARTMVGQVAKAGPIHVPPSPPATPPPPRPAEPEPEAPRYSALALASRGVLSTWAPLRDNMTPSPTGYADSLARAGCDWVAFQFNRENLNPELADLGAYVREARAKHVPLVGVWEQVSTTQRNADEIGGDLERMNLDFLIVCIEGPIGNPRLPAELRSRLGPTYPMTVLMTGGGREAMNHQSWISAGFGPVMTEAYVVENPQATPSAEDWEAKQRGWPAWARDLYSLPCAGVYHGYPYAAYTPLLTRWGPRHSVYAGETMSPADWAERAR